MFALLILESILLGMSSFVCGILPLSFVFSKSHLERLSTLGTGLLLGAALGVIIPEGIEAVASTNPDPSKLPTSEIALSLLFGFIFMLVIEQLLSSHDHSHPRGDGVVLQTSKGGLNQLPPSVEFDAELGDLEHDEGMSSAGYLQVDIPIPAVSSDSGVPAGRAFPLTFGLIIHGLADGLALGVSSLSNSESGGSSKLSLVVFLALIIHKAPTSLALTTSLLSIPLPRTQCKKHLVVFSVSTPVSAVASYLLFTLLGNRDGGGWAGVALLISGGTFLYVATVLQPVSQHSGPAAVRDMRPVTRVVYIVAGMLIPFMMSALLGHGH